MPEELVRQVREIKAEVYPQASAMAQLAQRVFKQGAAMAPDDARPVYLRDQVAWKKKDQQ
jgi:tRNA threonylcarbamoyladenosine biosynthesis protein TsaB